jgi:benzoylformate decarboxylase
MQITSNSDKRRVTTNAISELDKMGRRRGAGLLLDVLRGEGVQYVFGNPGTTELPFIDALVVFPTSTISGPFRKRVLSRWPTVMHKPRAAQDS